MNHKILFRCDAGDAPEIGTGHIARSKTLAKALISDGLIAEKEILFFTRHDKGFNLGSRYLDGEDFKFQSFDNNMLKANSDSEIKLLLNQNADLIIIDRLKTTSKLVKTLKFHGKKVVTFDDYGTGRLFADLAISSIFDDVPYSKNLKKGYEYLILSKKSYPQSIVNDETKKIVATFGGNDQRDICSHFLSIANSIPSDIEIDIILGKINDDLIKKYQDKIKSLKKISHIKLHVFPSNYHKIISSADLAISTGGLSIFEFSAFGIPSIGIPQYKHQLRTIQKLAKEGITKLGSDGMTLSNKKFLDAINLLISDNKLRKLMALNARNKIDGNGVIRIKDLLLSKFKEVFV